MHFLLDSNFKTDLTMERLKDKVVIITGASSGIGKALAYEFSKLGSSVCLVARRIELLEEIKKEIEGNGTKALAIKTDITVEEECKQMVQTVISEFGTIDILINNAGISMRALFIEVETNVLKHLMDVNFWGAVYCTKYALPYLLETKGSVVGVSSIAGFHGLPARTGYSASKFALHGFLETLRIEYLKQGLHVMVIAPGFTESEIRKHALNASGFEQGESPLTEDKLMSAEYVAKVLIRSIIKRKRNKILTFAGQITALFQRILPEQVDKAFYSAMKKEPDSPLKDL